MVKIEDYAESSANPNADIEYQQAIPRVEDSDLKPGSGPFIVKEECFPSSSSGHLRSHFVGMGFSSDLVEKVMKENGENDPELLLEALLAQSAFQKLTPETSSSLEGFSSSDMDEGDSLLEFTADGNEEHEAPSDSNVDRRSYLLSMNFSEQEVNSAINQLGANAPLVQLVDYIVTVQAAGFPVKEEMNASIDGDTGKNEGNSAETLFGMMDKTLSLLQMGFTEDEVSSAIDYFGPEVSILELADSIFASRYAKGVDQEEVKVNGKSIIKREFDYIGNVTTECPEYTSSSYMSLYDHEEKVMIKRAKHILDDKEASSSTHRQQGKLDEWKTASHTKPNSYDMLGGSTEERLIKEEVPELMTPNIQRKVHGLISKPPYFFYGNVLDVSQETWRKLSQFLYGIEPEFVNTRFFSAFIRKEGYIHNLPTQKRSCILPKPPMTIEDAFPHTKRWWPSWDTRKQLSCINSESTGVGQLCEQLRKIMLDSQGVLSREQQINILHQCKTFNLMWVGQDKLSPIEPHQVEPILGYPVNHTRLWGFEPAERLNALKYSFQSDTIGYILSVLKDIYPDGLRVLSIYTGIGGAEIALHRLGIHLKCVVSVEASEVNRKIMRRWWHNTEQSGVLRQLGGIGKLTIHRLEDFIKEFGSFDIVVGGNPGTCVTGSSTVNSSMGMDSNLFFEFVRVVQRVRSIIGRNN
ncbi:probable inactive DNA (cytosine-5)-methyltransferase DRM3 [Typha angustifolia]|uniref:probable inactive DNA (cytosine-5)-methyltransferase DRM3 n=1 Tax=Typha angustifolia TaxID=59011 RepID=UPI003C2ADAEC